MTRSPVSLDLIQVASPCHASWDDMSGDERVRFCRHCSLHVYNLSDMPRDQAEDFINKAEGRTCIRFFRREDGTLLTRDCPVGLRAMRQRLVRATMALAGMLLALATGTLFAGRLKIAKLPDMRHPSTAYAEWIEPGATMAFTMGWFCPPPGFIVIEPQLPIDPTLEPPQFEAPESSLPEPTPQQMQEAYDRLRSE